MQDDFIAELKRKQATRVLEAAETGAFFNKPSAALDVERWAKTPLWTVDEAVAISLGKEPAVVTWSALNDLAPYYRFAFTAEFAKRRDIARRAVEAGDIDPRARRDEWMAWLDSQGWRPPLPLDTPPPPSTSQPDRPSPAVPGTTQPPKAGGRKQYRQFSGAALRDWYTAWVEKHDAMGVVPSFEAEWKAVQALPQFAGVPRTQVRNLRAEHASHWPKKPGPRRPKDTGS